MPEVIHITCNMGTHGLPDMYAQSLGPAALGLWAYISGKSLMPMLQLLHILYSRKISRTINFTVFEDFTTISKINSLKSYYSVESYDSLGRSSKFNSRNVLWRDNLENFLPRKLPTIRYYLKHCHEFLWKIQHKGACQEINTAQGKAKCCIFRTHEHRQCFRWYIVL